MTRPFLLVGFVTFVVRAINLCQVADAEWQARLALLATIYDSCSCMANICLGAFGSIEMKQLCNKE